VPTPPWWATSSRHWSSRSTRSAMFLTETTSTARCPHQVRPAAMAYSYCGSRPPPRPTHHMPTQSSGLRNTETTSTHQPVSYLNAFPRCGPSTNWCQHVSTNRCQHCAVPARAYFARTGGGTRCLSSQIQRGSTPNIISISHHRLCTSLFWPNFTFSSDKL
jgi:hypothetical protein